MSPPPNTGLEALTARVMTTEEKLMVLAACHVAMFVGAAARVDRSAAVPATVAHALWLLIEEAQRQREEWLG